MPTQSLRLFAASHHASRLQFPPNPKRAARSIFKAPQCHPGLHWFPCSALSGSQTHHALIPFKSVTRASQLNPRPHTHTHTCTHTNMYTHEDMNHAAPCNRQILNCARMVLPSPIGACSPLGLFATIKARLAGRKHRHLHSVNTKHQDCRNGSHSTSASYPKHITWIIIIIIITTPPADLSSFCCPYHTLPQQAMLRLGSSCAAAAAAARLWQSAHLPSRPWIPCDE